MRIPDPPSLIGPKGTFQIGQNIDTLIGGMGKASVLFVERGSQELEQDCRQVSAEAGGSALACP